MTRLFASIAGPAVRPVQPAAVLRNRFPPRGALGAHVRACGASRRVIARIEGGAA